MIMGMDMDIPLPDELEWLEANSHHLHEEQTHEQQLPQSPQIDACKRPPDSTLSSDGKKSKTRHLEVDEDWLLYSPPPQNQEIVMGEEEEQEERILYKYASEIDGDFFPVTAPGGNDRVYAKLCRVSKEEASMKIQSNGLMLEPVNVLMQRMDQEAFTRALNASSDSQSDEFHPETHVHEQLWVDKYSPRSFTELLSDEQTNREVLLWLKQWDSSVFGSEIRSTSNEVLSALRRHSSVTQHQKHFDAAFLRKTGRQRFSTGNTSNSNSSHNVNNLKGFQEMWHKKSSLTGPPEQKILLLCGPPGLGKTTLAHVAAKHCGYRVVEVNASDDRSLSSIEAKILDVVQMNSVISDSKPKCLVIDEIDGALGEGKGAVEVILKMVSTERNSDTAKENFAEEEHTRSISSKKRLRKTVSLSRPVICICNDLYAPALRPLRQVAKVHIFVQPTVSRVVNRLKYICNQEGIRTSSIALAALAEYTECDIRCCLNTLQFLNKKKETLNALEIGSQVVGQKDISRSVFDIWKEIFQKRKTRKVKQSGSSSCKKFSGFDFLYSLISNRGDYDIIMDGMHENILQLQYHDPLMQKTVKCFNSFGISDLLNQRIFQMQQFTLNVYQTPLAITVHCLVSDVQKPHIEWPKSYQRYRTTMMDNTDMLRIWRSKIPPYISRHLSTKSVVEDLVSPLLHILSPATLKPVALHLLSEKERNDLAQLISIMVAYSITYRNTKNGPLSCNQEHDAALDASMLSFDPPICDLINFKGYSFGHFVLPLAVKQVLVHEVAKQKILQVSRSMHLTNGCNREYLELECKNSAVPSAETDHAASTVVKVQNGMNVLCPGTSNTSGANLSTLDSSGSAKTIMKDKSLSNLKNSRNSTNFFDRFRKISRDSQNTDATSKKPTTFDKDSRPLLFKFNEGFTNAVKKPVRMREFLL
ncbi:hypothetical protein K2173_014393 [Erythroxylum novogranatense]|uniref:Chromosome transmission fidelity protein 18 homolog n=1 Tax=Erythroxylum novogranatense TaxID=1862640 RepID=A0AAV8S608_9ROSI|nr:hypothetical protein K2173_014393 [Erythroxylum novogranatense]